MIKNTTYNLVDTIRYLAGEERYKDYYNFYQEIKKADVQEMYTKFSDKFDVKRPVASILVDTFKDLDDVINGESVNVPYGLPATNTILSASNLKDYIGKVVVFTSAVNNLDVHFDAGMKAKIVSIFIKDQGTKEEHFHIIFDISEFHEHNLPLMKAEYWAAREGDEKETWAMQRYYPMNKEGADKGITSEYFSNPMPFLLSR